MKGGSFSRVTSVPFSAPVAAPTASPTRIEIGTGIPNSTDSLPMMTDTITMTAPTDKSMPAVNTTSDCAAARVPTTATCCRISDRLKAEKKLGAISPKAPTDSTSTMTGTMVG